MHAWELTVAIRKASLDTCNVGGRDALVEAYYNSCLVNKQDYGLVSFVKFLYLLLFWEYRVAVEQAALFAAVFIQVLEMLQGFF